MGNMYYHGLGVEKDWSKSKELYGKAASTDKNAELLLEELLLEEKQQQKST